MACAACDAPTVAFRVPPDLREFAPGEATAVCTRCLDLSAAETAADPDFSRIIDGFPEGEAGAAMALAAGLLVDSLALNRAAVLELFERVREGGADPWLVLERLAAAGSVDPDADLDRLRRQLDQLA